MALLGVARGFYLRRAAIDPPALQEGQAFRVPAPREIAAPSQQAARRPILDLLEDGQPLPHPGASLETVIRQGRGAWIWQGAQVIFSSSDGSDPRTNGRAYSFRFMGPTSALVFGPLARWALTLGLSSLAAAWLLPALLGLAGGRRRLGVWRGLYLLALLAILVIGVLQRSLLDTPPIADADTWGYFGPALSWLGGGPFSHVHGRHFLYPALMAGLVGSTGSITAIATVQHLAGLSSGVLLLLSWHALPVAKDARPLGVLMHRLCGVGLFASMICCPRLIGVEHMIRPESFYMLVLCGIIFCLVRILGREYAAVRPGPAVAPWCSGLILLSLVASALKPQSSLAVVVCMLLVLLVCWRQELGWLRGSLTFLVPLMLFVLLIWLPEQRLAQQDGQAGLYLPGCLLSAHMDMIADTMREDLDDATMPQEERTFLEHLVSLWEQDAARSWSGFTLLGFDPQQPFYKSVYPAIRKHFDNDRSAWTRFCLSYYARTVWSQPVAMALKVWRQLQKVFGPPESSWVYSWDTRLDLHAAMANTSFFMHRQLERKGIHYGLAQSYAERAAESQAGVVELDWPGFERDRGPVALWFAGLQYSFRWVILSGLLGCVLALSWPRVAGRVCGRLARLALVLFLLLLSIHLTSAAVFTLEIGRYIFSQQPLTVFVQFLFLWTIVSLLLDALSRRHESGTRAIAAGSPEAGIG